MKRQKPSVYQVEREYLNLVSREKAAVRIVRAHLRPWPEKEEKS